MICEIRHFMEHTPGLRALVPLIRETTFMRNRRDRLFQERAEKRKDEFKLCYEAHKSEFETVFAMLEDDFSRETFRSVIEYRLKPRKEILEKIVVKPAYFQKDILRPVENEVFVDGGAYVGDTIKSLADDFFEGGVNTGRKFTHGNLMN